MLMCRCMNVYYCQEPFKLLEQLILVHVQSYYKEVYVYCTNYNLLVTLPMMCNVHVYLYSQINAVHLMFVKDLLLM